MGKVTGLSETGRASTPLKGGGEGRHCRHAKAIICQFKKKANWGMLITIN